MDIRQLQTALKTVMPGFGDLNVDGIAGKQTMKVVDALLEAAKISFTSWTDERRRIAAEQIIYRDAGIEVGAIDGLVGEQTRYARTVWAARKAKTGQPDPAVENWRDAEVAKPAPIITPKHEQWPRQRDVASFYGAVGTNQVMCDLPFPMRIAWEPSKTVSRFSCHAKCRDAFTRIWTNTLKHYGHEQIVKLRLDMFGGCLNVRKMRGGSAWSMHSWGIAEDVDPDRNQLKFHRAQATLDDPVYDKFWEFVYAEGALSLGRERDYDWMHFQFTRDFS